MEVVTLPSAPHLSPPPQQPFNEMISPVASLPLAIQGWPHLHFNNLSLGRQERKWLTKEELLSSRPIDEDLFV